jgi:hypothetical protein
MILVQWVENPLDVPVQELGKKVLGQIDDSVRANGAQIPAKIRGAQILESPRSINNPFKAGISRCIRK